MASDCPYSRSGSLSVQDSPNIYFVLLIILTFIHLPTISIVITYTVSIIFQQHQYPASPSHIFIMAQANFPVYSTAVAVPVLALIAFIIDIPPLAWHIRNRNLAASSLVGWVMLSNLMNFINALIWPTDDIANWWTGSGLCDVEVKLMIAITFGFVGSLLCIMRNLAKVLDTKRTILSHSRTEKRKENAFECLLCFGGPVYSIAVHYIVQPSRYYIFAISGCTTSYDNSWPKLVLILIWPPLLSVVVVYYSGEYTFL